MEGGKEISCSPVIPVHEFHDGDLVHVFEGTGVGQVHNRAAGWFGRVVGREGNTYLVRNRLYTAKGSPSRVDGVFLKLQRDYSCGTGAQSGSEERVHFRTLSKRTRDRILNSADEHNNDIRNTAERALAKVKKQKSQETQAHVLRRDQITQQGLAALQESKTDYDRKLMFLEGKCDMQEKQKEALKEHHKTMVKQKEVFHCLVLSWLIFSCLRSFTLPYFLFLLPLSLLTPFSSLCLYVYVSLCLCVFVIVFVFVCLRLSVCV